MDTTTKEEAMPASEQLRGAIATAYTQGMTYEQIVAMIKTQCALHEHATR